MPVLHSYVSKTGFYIRSQVDGDPITFQVSPAGAEVLRDLGYRSQSDIPWSVLRPLYEQGDIYTENTGVEKRSIEAKQATDLSHLNEKQRDRLRTYLNQDTSDISVHQIRKDIQELLGLSMLALAKRELESLTISPTLKSSLNSFLKIPYQAQSIDTPRKHEIAYEFAINETTFYCFDSRWQIKSPYDFKVVGQITGDEKQIIHIRDGYLTKLYLAGDQQQSGDNITERHSSIYQTASLLPNIRELFLHLPQYNIRPDPENPGHGDLTSGDDLIGKHIWVTPEKYARSGAKSLGKLVVSEPKNIFIRTDTWEPRLVKVMEKSPYPNSLFGSPVSQHP